MSLDVATTQGLLFSQEELDEFHERDAQSAHAYTLERQTPARIEQIAGLLGRGWPVKEVARFMRCSDHLVTKVAMLHPALVATQKEITGRKLLAASGVFLDSAVGEMEKMKPFERVLAAGIAAQRGMEMVGGGIPGTVVVVQADHDHGRRVAELVASAESAVAGVRKLLMDRCTGAPHAHLHASGTVVDVIEATPVERGQVAGVGGGGIGGRGWGRRREG